MLAAELCAVFAPAREISIGNTGLRFPSLDFFVSLARMEVLFLEISFVGLSVLLY